MRVQQPLNLRAGECKAVRLYPQAKRMGASTVGWVLKQGFEGPPRLSGGKEARGKFQARVVMNDARRNARLVEGNWYHQHWCSSPQSIEHRVLADAASRI